MSRSNRDARVAFWKVAITFLVSTASFWYSGPGHAIVWSIAVFIVVAVVANHIVHPLFRKQWDDCIEAEGRRVATFRPYTVRIYPNRLLFVDHGLIDAQLPKDNPAPWEEGAALGWMRPGWTHPGIGFTRLTERYNEYEMRENTLVFWDDSKTFSADVAGAFGLVDPSASEMKMEAYIRLEECSEGVRIKLTTEDDRRQHINDLEGEPDPGRDLALLPWTEFWDEHELIMDLVLGKKDQYEAHVKNVKRLRDEAVAEHGWKREQGDLRGDLHRLTHKYFSVTWRFI